MDVPTGCWLSSSSTFRKIRLTIAEKWNARSLGSNFDMITFNFIGIPVRIAPWFWVTMVFLGGGMTAATQQDIINVLLFVFAGFISIFVHELGHALTVRKYGLPVAITLVAFGGVASFPAGKLDRKQSFMVTAAGPGVQLVLGFLAVAVIRYMPMPEYSLLRILLLDLVWISIVWAVFNCMPIFPMDGGRMLSIVAGEKRRRLVHITGIVFSVGLGLFLFWTLKTWLLPVYMGYFAWINWQAIQAS